MGFVRNLTGKTAANAAVKGAGIQSDAATLAAEQVGAAGEQAGSLIRSGGGVSQRLVQQEASRAGDLVQEGGRLAGEHVQFGGDRAIGLLNQFKQVGQQGVDQAGFLTDPQAQFDFLQNNPLFQLGLDNANRQTSQLAASRGRLSAGDTLTQLNNNALLTASPLIAQQKQSIGDLLNIGQNTALNQGNIFQNIGLNRSNIVQNTAGNQGNILQSAAANRANIIQNSSLNQANILQGTAANQGNLLTGAAAAEAAGLVGAANAKSSGAANILNLGAQIGGAIFSDPALKENITLTGVENGFNIYSWDWNDKAIELGLSGSNSGVMANEVLSKEPKAISIDRGYMKVNYGMIGVKH
jgi:hypothetical protein